MTDQQHPITPPPELVAKIRSQALSPSISQRDYEDRLVIAAYRAGADQELKACCELLDINGCPGKWIDMLRAARRPKPKSLAEEALLAIDTAVADDRLSPAVAHAVRRALERLQELEGQDDD